MGVRHLIYFRGLVKCQRCNEQLGGRSRLKRISAIYIVPPKHLLGSLYKIVLFMFQWMEEKNELEEKTAPLP